MKSLIEFVQQAEKLVKYQIQSINNKDQSLFDCEKTILNLVYEVGSLIETMILKEIKEPVRENRVKIHGKEAIYKGTSNLTFTDRFGHTQTIRRRAYKIQSQEGYIFPLDHSIGIKNCRRYSPLVSYLIGSYGGNESYGCSSRLLSSSLGFLISTTAIQNNAERIGKLLPDDPIRSIPDEKLNKECDLMIVESDGTMSPQIPEIQGITGRESLKVPTEYNLN